MTTDAEARAAVSVLLAYRRRQFKFFRTLAFLSGIIFVATLLAAIADHMYAGYIMPIIWLTLTVGNISRAYQHWKWVKDE